MSEKLDIFDANYNHIGIEDRDTVHNKGLWHHVFICWIVNPKTKKIVFQLRSASKKSSPNKLFPTGGHLSTGEKAIDGIREIEEELGLNIKKENLIYIGQVIYVKNNKDTNGNPFINREFCLTYFLKDETPLEEYIMQPEEVDGVFEINIEDGLKLFSDEVNNIEASGFSRVKNKRILKNIQYKDFIDHGRDYYLKIFIMAERLVEGKKYLAV